MKMYLSYGGGVNSTAMLLLLLDKGWEFESVYVDHGCDWPETREYVQMLSEKYPITVLKPQIKRDGRIYDNIYEFAVARRTMPFRNPRWCTSDFKIKVLHKYFQAPCFSLIGIDASEAHRAKMGSTKGIENRFPLLEYGVNRQGCVDIIKSHGLPVPIKSGCWFCPFQQIRQWKKLRKEYPELFCAARKMEIIAGDSRVERGKPRAYLIGDRPLDAVVSENQTVMWPEMKPPCSCGL